jgi:hypothetical protein
MQTQPCAHLQSYLDLACDRIGTTPGDGTIAIKHMNDLFGSLIESAAKHSKLTIMGHCQLKESSMSI